MLAECQVLEGELSVGPERRAERAEPVQEEVEDDEVRGPSPS